MLSPSRFSILLAFVIVGAVPIEVNAQRIDSVHVFRAITRAAYTSASANALAWRLHHAHADHVTLKGDEMAAVHEGLAQYTPMPHLPGPLPDVTHLAMLFTNGRPVALGITEDLDLVINFTARKEYRISSFTDHLRVRAILAELMLRH